MDITAFAALELFVLMLSLFSWPFALRFHGAQKGPLAEGDWTKQVQTALTHIKQNPTPA